MSDKLFVSNADMDWMDNNRELMTPDEIGKLDAALANRKEVPTDFVTNVRRAGILSGGNIDTETRDGFLSTFMADHLRVNMQGRTVEQTTQEIFGKDPQSAFTYMADVFNGIDKVDAYALLPQDKQEAEARQELEKQREADKLMESLAALETAGEYKEREIPPVTAEEVQERTQKKFEKAFAESPKLMFEYASRTLSPKNERLAWQVALNRDPEAGALFHAEQIQNMSDEQQGAFWMMARSLNPEIDADFISRLGVAVWNPFANTARGMADWAKGQGWDLATMNDNAREVFDRTNENFTDEEIERLSDIMAATDEEFLEILKYDSELASRLESMAEKAVVVFDEMAAMHGGMGAFAGLSGDEYKRKKRNAVLDYMRNWRGMYAQGGAIRRKEEVVHRARQAFAPRYTELGVGAELALDVAEGATYMASLATVSMIPYVGGTMAGAMMYAPQQAEWERQLIYDYNVKPADAKILSSGFGAAYAAVEHLQIKGLDPKMWKPFIGSQQAKQLTTHYLKEWFKRGARQSAQETAEEWIQTGIELSMLGAAEQWAGAQGIDWDAETEQAFKEMAHTAITMPGITFLGGGMLRGKAVAKGAREGGLKGAVGGFIPEEWKQARADMKRAPNVWEAIQKDRKRDKVIKKKDFVPPEHAIFFEANRDVEAFQDPETGKNYTSIDDWMRDNGYNPDRDMKRFTTTVEVMQIEGERKAAETQAVDQRLEAAREDLDSVPIPVDGDPFWGAVDFQHDRIGRRLGYELEKFDTVAEFKKAYPKIDVPASGVAFPGQKKAALIKETIGDNAAIAKQKYEHELIGHLGLGDVDSGKQLIDRLRTTLGDQAITELLGEEYKGVYDDPNVTAEELIAHLVERLDPEKIEQELKGGSIRKRFVRWLDEAMGVQGADELKARELMRITLDLVRGVEQMARAEGITETETTTEQPRYSLAYHGTEREFEKYDFNAEKIHEDFGDYMYFTDSPETASYYGKKLKRAYIPDSLITKTVDAKNGPMRNVSSELGEKDAIIKVVNVADMTLLGAQVKGFEYGSTGDGEYKYPGNITVNMSISRYTKKYKQMVNDARELGIDLHVSKYMGKTRITSLSRRRHLSEDEATKLQKIGFKVMQGFRRTPKTATTYVVTSEKALDRIRESTQREYKEQPRYSLTAREDPIEMSKRVIAARMVQKDKRVKEKDARTLLNQMKYYIGAQDAKPIVRKIIDDATIIARGVISSESQKAILNEADLALAINTAADELQAEQARGRINQKYRVGGEGWNEAVAAVDEMNKRRLKALQATEWKLTKDEMDEEFKLFVDDKTDGTNEEHNRKQNAKIRAGLKSSLFDKAKRQKLFDDKAERFEFIERRHMSRLWMLEGYRNTARAYLTDISHEFTHGAARNQLTRQIAQLDRYHGTSALDRRINEILNQARKNRVKQTRSELIDRVDKATAKFKGRVSTRKPKLKQQITAAGIEFYKHVRKWYKASPDDVNRRAVKINEELTGLKDGKPDENQLSDYEGITRIHSLMRELHALMQFGAFNTKTLGEMAEATEFLELHYDKEVERQETKRFEEAQKYAETRDKVKATLPNRLHGGDDNWYRNFNSATQFLKFRLEGLVRFGQGQTRKDALKDMEALSFRFAAAGTQKEVAVFQDNEAFTQALLQIYAGGSRGRGEIGYQADRNAAGKIVAELTRRRPEYRKFSNNGWDLSKANLLQMVGLLAQEDYRKVALMQRELEREVKALKDRLGADAEKIGRALWKTPKSLIKWTSKHGYELSKYELEKIVDSILKGSNRARRLDMEPAILQELDQKDVDLLNWFRQYYRENREELSRKNKEITGFSFPRSDRNYIPAKMDIEKQVMGGFAIFMPIVPPSLTPRTFNTADFDEKADIITLWQQRLEGNQQFLKFADLYLDVQGIFNNKEFIRDMRNTHGNKYVNQLLTHMRDTISGTPISSGRNSTMDAVTNFMAITKLGFNVSLLPRQITSLPSFAMYVPTKTFFESCAGWWTKEGRERMRRIRNHPYAQRRMKQGNTQVLVETLSESAAKKRTIWDAYKRIGTIPTRYGDIIPTMIFGQGYYQSMLEKAKEDGMEPEIAEQWAMDQLWTLVEMSQQSGMMHNLAEWQRHGGSFGRLIGQFQSTPMQFWAKQVFDFRELQAAYENRAFESDRLNKAAKQFGKTSVINFLVLGTLYEAMKMLWYTVLGAPPDEDDFTEMIIASVSSPLGGMLIIGTVIECGLAGIIKGERGYGQSLLPASSILSDTQTIGRFVNDLLTGNVDEMCKDADNIAKSLNPMYRDARKAYENYTD